jgi:hypothetical protein
MSIQALPAHDDHYDVKQAVPCKGLRPPLMHLRRADIPSKGPPADSQSPKPSFNKAKLGFEISMTLKQACSSEYQGAQGAFKDSMIHGKSAIHITYRDSLRSSSMREPRDPLLKVIL